MAKKEYSLAHTKWMCKYHIVFTPKYRRKIIYNQYKEDIGRILRQLCSYKGVEIIEGHLMPDHIHMLVSIPPKYSVSSIMGYLKGKSALMIFDKHANLKYKPHPGVNKQQSTSHRERTVIWGLYYEILANQIRRMQMSFRFRCKGVVRNNVSHEVYFQKK